MADIVTQRNIGGYITGLTSAYPQSSAAATVTGVSIDRQAHGMPLSCTMHTAVGAVGGAPTTTSVVTTLQHAPDNSTWTTYQPDGVNNATATAITAATSDSELDVDLTLAYRYIRTSTVVGFTGGTSPTVLFDTKIVVGGESYQPAI